MLNFSDPFYPQKLLRESFFEDLPQQNEQVFLIWVSYRFLFRDVYCCSFGHAAIFIRCRNVTEISKSMLGWLVWNTPLVLLFSALVKSLKTVGMRFFWLQKNLFLTNLQLMQRFLGYKVYN